MADRKSLAAMSIRAREAVSLFIEAFDDPKVKSEKLDACNLLLVNLDDEVPDILAEVMETGGWWARIMAAEMFCKATSAFPRMAARYKNTLRGAEQILVAALQDDSNLDNLRMVCLLIGRIGVVPLSAVPVLEQLVAESEDELTRVCAAAALCWEGVPIAVSTLVQALHSENGQVRFIAAPTLALHGRFRTQQAIAVFVEVFNAGDSNDKIGLVRLVHEIGPPAIGTVDALAEMLHDQQLPSFHRARAAAAIGSVTKGTDKGSRILLSALRSSDWQIVNGAAEGLSLSGHSVDRAVRQLAALLEAADSELRHVAAVGLKRFGPEAKYAVPAIIARFCAEPDSDICYALIETLQAIGEAAVKPLVNEARKLDLRQFPMIGMSLKGLADNAVGAVIEELLKDADERIRGLGVIVLQNMGVAAAPAIPVLAKLLKEAEDVEHMHNLIGAIGVCGSAASTAADAVVECLVRNSNEDVTEIATTVLGRMGEPGLAALQRAATSAAGEATKRIDAAIAACQTRIDKRFERLEQLNRDDLLRLFVLVGDVLMQEGQASWSKVADQIGPQLTFTRVDGKPFGTTDKPISKAVKTLAELVGLALTDHTPQRRGGLTSEGRVLLNEAKEYLRQKYGSDPRLEGN